MNLYRIQEVRGKFKVQCIKYELNETRMGNIILHYLSKVTNTWGPDRIVDADTARSVWGLAISEEEAWALWEKETEIKIERSEMDILELQHQIKRLERILEKRRTSPCSFVSEVKT